jgi:hypothetical protein
VGVLRSDSALRFLTSVWLVGRERFIMTCTDNEASPVGPVGKLVGWFESGLDSDHLLSPVTINWFAGVSIM